MLLAGTMPEGLGLVSEGAWRAQFVDRLGELLLGVGQGAGLRLQRLQLVDPRGEAVFIMSSATRPAASSTMQTTAKTPLPVSPIAAGTTRSRSSGARRPCPGRPRAASRPSLGWAAVALSWL